MLVKIDSEGLIIEMDVKPAKDSDRRVVAFDMKLLSALHNPRYSDGIWEEGASEALISAFNKENYMILRKRAYPPFEDYLDAKVKGDNVAEEEYRQKCLDVKARYPK